MKNNQNISNENNEFKEDRIKNNIKNSKNNEPCYLQILNWLLTSDNSNIETINNEIENIINGNSNSHTNEIRNNSILEKKIEELFKSFQKETKKDTIQDQILKKILNDDETIQNENDIYTKEINNNVNENKMVSKSSFLYKNKYLCQIKINDEFYNNIIHNFRGNL